MKKRRFLKIAKRIFLFFFGMLLACIITALLGLRSDWGKQKLLAFLVAKINERSGLHGFLSIGKMETDYISFLTLKDIVLTDSENGKVISFEEIRCSYHVKELWSKKLHITSLQLQQGNIELRKLSNGTLNLVSVFQPLVSSPSSPLPFSVQIDQIDGKISTSYYVATPVTLNRIIPVSLKGLAVFSSFLQVQGSLTLTHQDFQMDKLKLTFRMETPFQTTLELQGGFVQKEHFVLQPTKLSLSLPGDLLKKWVPSFAGEGRLQLGAELQGPLSQLELQGDLQTQAGLLKLVASANIEKKELPWKIQVTSQDLQPHRLYSQLADGKVKFSLQGRGDRQKGFFEIENAQGILWGTQLETQVSAAVDFVQKELIWASGSIFGHVLDGGLLPIEKFNLQKGALSARAHFFYALGSVEADLFLQGRELSFLGGNMKTLQSHVHWKDNEGAVSLQGQGIRILDLFFKNINLQAHGDQNQIWLKSQGMGPSQTAFQLEASALPLFQNGFSVDVALLRLKLSKAGQTWSLQQKADVQLSFINSFSVRLPKLLLGSSVQRISLQGSYQHDGRQFDLLAKSQHLDLQRIASLFWKKPFLPHTSLGFSVALHGNLYQALGHIQIQGSSSKFSTLAWQATKYSLSADLNQNRIVGKLALKSQRTDLISTFRVPFSFRKPVAVNVKGYGPLPLFQKLFPDSLQDLQGKFSFEGKLGGTLQKPQVFANVILPEFQTKKILGKETSLLIQYENDQIKLGGHSTLCNVNGSLLGKVAMNVDAPLALRFPTTMKNVLKKIGQAPLSGEMNFQKLQVIQLAQLFSLEQSEVQISDLQGKISISGSLAKPQIGFHMDSNQVIFPRWFKKPGSWFVDATYLGDKIDFTSSLQQEGASLAIAKGNLTLATMFAEEGPGWKDAPLSVDVTLNPLPLSLPFGISTNVAGKFHMGGTLGHLVWNLDAQGKQTQLSGWEVGDIQIQATPEKDGMIFADIHVNQVKGGQVNAQVHIPLLGPFDIAKVSGDLISKKFVVAYQPKEEPSNELRVLKGIVDTKLHFVFPEGQPKVTGLFQLAQGAVLIRSEPRVYQNITIDFQSIEKQNLVIMKLNQLYAEVSGGSLGLQGMIHFRGAKLEQATLMGSTKQFPLSQGNLGMWLDSTIDITARTEPDHLDVALNMKTGTLKIPQLSSDKDLQSLEFQSELATQVQKEISSQKQGALASLLFVKSIPQKAMIHVNIKEENPLLVDGSEVKGKVAGNLTIEIDLNGLIKPKGSFYALSGSAQLFRKDYDVNQAEISFDGSLTPNLYLRLSRPISNGTLYVDAQGSPSKLTSSLRTDPADYSQSEILALFRGDAPDGGSTKGQGALSLFSNLVVGQIKQQFGDKAKYLLIDTIRVDEDLTNSREGSARVEVGKNFSILGGTVYVSYSQQFGGDTVGTKKQNRYQGRAEFRLFRDLKLPKSLEFLRKVQLDGSYGDAGVGNIDLSYHTRRF